MLTPERIEEALSKAVYLLRDDDISAVEAFDRLLKLLLLKKACDEHEETTKNEENHSPSSEINSFWLELKKSGKDLAEKIFESCVLIEEVNPKYKNILSVSEVNTWEEISNITLYRLIDSLSQLSFINNQSVLIADVFDQIFERFISKTNRSIDGAITPSGVAKLLVNLIQPSEDVQICDPACRSGEVLVECTHYLKECEKDPSKVELFGQEKNNQASLNATARLLLRNSTNFEVLSRDVTECPLLTREGELVLFDLIITNPPFGVGRRRKEKRNDSYGRFVYGNPPNSSDDFAFIQHVIATLKKNGKAAIVVPRGVLFREGSEGIIRRNIVVADLIEAVIELPQGIFYESPISTAIIIFNKKKNEEAQKKVLFINAAYGVKASLRRTFPTDSDISKIVATYFEFLEKVGYSRIVTLEEIAERNYDLQVSQYTMRRTPVERLDASGTLSRIRALENSRTRLTRQMDDCLRALGIEI